MTDLRSKAREIKDAGVAERGNFEPTGVPKRMYQYWLRASNSNKAGYIRNGTRRENFCHFWRVVAIWAPLLFLRNLVVDIFEVPGVQVGTAVLAIAALVLSGITFQGTVGFFLLCVLAGTAVLAALVGVAYLIDAFWPRKWNKIFTYVPHVLFGALFALFLFMLGASIVEFGWVAVFAILGTIAGVALMVFSGIILSDFISGRRAMKNNAARARIAAMSDDEYRAWNNAAAAAREPGFISKFFSGVGDFIVLVFQVVRVNKWKICPLVDVKNEPS